MENIEIGSRSRSTFDPSIPLASLGQASLFPLHHAGITFHEFRFSEDGVNLRDVRYDGLSNSVGECAGLTGRAAAADDSKHVERAEDARKLEGTHDALAVGGRSEELVERQVVDEDRSRRHGHARGVRRQRKCVVHNRRDEIITSLRWHGLLLLLADGDHPDARGALLAFADGVRAAVAVEGDVFACCAREDLGLVVALEELEDGVDARGERVVARDRRDARALLEVGEHGDHAAVARGGERAGEHRRHALAVAPEVLRWREGGARERRQGKETQHGERAAAALEGRFELVEVVVVARAGGVEGWRLGFGLFAWAEARWRRISYVLERGRGHIWSGNCREPSQGYGSPQRPSNGECGEHETVHL